MGITKGILWLAFARLGYRIGQQHCSGHCYIHVQALPSYASSTLHRKPDVVSHESFLGEYVLWALAALGRLPVDVLVRYFNVTCFAVDTTTFVLALSFNMAEVFS